jgi:hypothetical protein
MDLAYFLNQRLAFVEYFHTGTTASFQEVKRKIEAGEPPYVDTRDPAYVDEPTFFEEWEKADAAMTITGAACLDLLQSTFHVFLNEYMRQIGQEKIIPQLPQLKKLEQKGWFGNYKVFFQVDLQIDWAASGADLDLLEQVILTRNDFTHNSDLLSFDAFQTLFHSEKYPSSAFADPKWKTMLMRRTPLSVPTETLHRATETLRTLCEYLDRERYALTKRWRIERKAEALR